MLTTIINSRAWTTWTEVQIEADWFTPADAWSVTLRAPPMVQVQSCRPGAVVELVEDRDFVLRGRIDAAELVHERPDGLRLTLRGRDLAAVLVDSTPPAGTAYANATVWRVAKAAADLAGLRLVQRPDAVLDAQLLRQPKRDETWMAWLQRLALVAGCWPRVTATGELHIERPNYISTPVGQVVLGGDVLSWSHNHDITHRVGTLVGDRPDDDGSVGSVRVVDAEAEAAWPNRVQSVSPRRAVERRRSARQVVTYERDRRIFESETLQVRVAGWRANGTIWQPGQAVVVDGARFGLGGSWWVQTVKLQRSLAGSLAELTLKKPNIIKEAL
ncbi:hypothetical protein L6R49_10360 [Myxococcota bacterium]|nr:hypothetical protein [Myxococcota bacterium]